MAVTMIVISCVLWAASLVSLFGRPLLGPAFSYLGLLAISFAGREGHQVVPVNGVMLTAWLCMTVVVMLATLMQPKAVNRQSRGMGYILVGALVGMAVGLLGFSVGSNLSLLYGIMIVATVAGIFFGFLLYSNTPEGRSLSPRSGNFFRYLMAKGFPVAITVLQPGVVLVLLIALHTPITQ